MAILTSKNCPSVVYSESPVPEEKQKCKNLGAMECISKDAGCLSLTKYLRSYLGS
jgi:hypothetical protein